MRLHEIVQTGYEIFCDMDGVLTDFESSALRLTQSTEYDKSDFWKSLHSLELDEVEKFWATMPWHPGGKKLWTFIGRYNPTVLSAPDNSRPEFREACESGKTQWIKKNLRPTPKNVIFETDKFKYAHSNSVLIDDKTKNIDPWEQAGGFGILYINPNSAISKLKDMGFKVR